MDGQTYKEKNKQILTTQLMFLCNKKKTDSKNVTNKQ